MVAQTKYKHPLFPVDWACSIIDGIFYYDSSGEGLLVGVKNEWVKYR